MSGKKDFDKWNELKKNLNNSEKSKSFYFKEREIWWCSLGVNIGFEEDGKHDLFERPVLIIKKFNNEVLWILPLTGRHKDGRYYYNFTYKNNPESVILSQVRLIDRKRLHRKIWMLPENDFQQIKKLTVNLLQ